MDTQTIVKDIFLEGLKRCSPNIVVQQALHVEGDELRIKDQHVTLDGRPTYIFATGKASVPMYESTVKILNHNDAKSLVVTSDAQEAQNCSADEVLVGSHPAPDAESLKAGERVIRFMESVPKNGIVINLTSGGTSSLLCMPAAGISIGALSETFDFLNRSGATIHQINTVRKHCSQIKGGQLLRYLSSQSTVINLAISDVPDDDISIIGSGPTIPDHSTFEDARRVLEKFELWDMVPESVTNHIQKGINREVPETVKPDEVIRGNHISVVISSASKLANTIGDLVKEKGFSVKIADQPFNDDVEFVASKIAESVLSAADKKGEQEESSLQIYWGESTVEVTGEGKGGRNQELALRGAQKIAGYKNITWLCAGTDGIDGPTDAAGAIVDGASIDKAKAKNVDPETYLASNDSYHFHEQMGTLLKTGPTGNNLMDVVLVFIE